MGIRKLKKGDEVIVTAGRDKGKRGSVVQVLPTDQIIVEGVNVVKKHTKGNPQRGTQSGIFEKEKPLNISNVSLFNPQSGKADRTGIKVLEDGRKVRFAKRSGEIIDL
mgnify:CR=1 FL=1